MHAPLQRAAHKVPITEIRLGHDGAPSVPMIVIRPENRKDLLRTLLKCLS